MKLPVSPPLDPVRASFQTHLNYAKRLDLLLTGCEASITPAGAVRIHKPSIERFAKLHKLTRKSIEKDIELAREDPAFAVIAAPWFPVKCYYALYYLESILTHFIDGTLIGFTRGGHKGIRTKMATHLGNGMVVFNSPDLNRVPSLQEVQALPAIISGRNARAGFWRETECTDCVLKKMTEYRLHDAKADGKWDLRTIAGRAKRDEFTTGKQIACLDFFYWYRIKANYRDLDYIDFENGIAAAEVLEYVEAFYSAYARYRELLIAQIERVGRRSG